MYKHIFVLRTRCVKIVDNVVVLQLKVLYYTVVADHRLRAAHHRAFAEPNIRFGTSK